MGYNPPGSSVHGDSTGRNTGVCFHALLQRTFPIQGMNLGLLYYRQILSHLSHKESYIYFIYIYESESLSVVSDPLRPHGLYLPWNSPGQNTGGDCHSLLQGILPSQGSNLGLPHCRWILYQLSHKGSPRKLEWVAHPFSRGSPQPRNLHQLSHCVCVCVCMHVCVCVCIYIYIYIYIYLYQYTYT